MFRSKKDVDAHVRDVFSKCKSENERLKLCFGIAKQYCSIREFDSARRYLETYVNSSPVNLAEAHKLMGDIQQELGDCEKALESYKSSYSEGKARDSLNRVCDLLTRGFGSKETPESKKKWFDMQKSTVNNNPLSATSSTTSSPGAPRRAPLTVGGPPKSGFNHSSFTNGSPSPLVSSASKTNGGNVDLQLRYLERRFDDGLGKILDQNTLVLEQMLKIKEDMRDLADKVEHVAVNQEQMQVELKELKEKQKETQALALENKQNRQAIQQMSLNNSCKNCEGRPVRQEVHQTCNSAVELAALKEQMDRLEKRTTNAIENLQASLRFPQTNPTVPPPQFTTPPQPISNFGFPATNTVTPTFNFTNDSNHIATPPSVVSVVPSAPSYNFSSESTIITTPPTMISVASSVVDGSTPKKSEEGSESTFPPLNLSGKFSFADLAKNNSSGPSFSFATTTSAQPFSGTGAPLFSSLSIADNSGEKKAINISAHEEGEDDFVPTAEFQPVIPLPPLVEVKKGDEDENTVAEYRAKLYRFIAETKEWKERGVGNIKLLQSKDNERKCRVVMWREKVGKLACNFSLFPDIKITNYQNNPKVLCWKCQDCTEELTWETFTLRFGNEDNCAHFKTEMERLAKMTVAAVEKSPSSIKAEPVAEAVPTGGNKEVPLSQLFKKPEGSWNCEACYCTNGNDATSCVACQTSRPGYEHVPKPSTAEAEVPQPTFSFGFPAANTAAPTFNFGFANSNNTTPVPVSSAPVEDSTPKKSEDCNDSAFPPLNLSGKFSFADLAKNNNPVATFSFATTPSTQPFSGAGAPLFSSLSIADNSGEKKAINTSTHEEGEDDFVPTAEFQPVIPLPPLVEVKKGDEDENTVAEYRAKLYRFIAETKEWKERGVGNIKLLQSKDNERKCRVVMWREKVGKLACNFNLFPDIKITNYQNNPKVLCWKCQDCTEELTWETFTLRFGNEENCAHFKTEMERLAKMTVAAGDKSPSSIKTEPVSPEEAPSSGNKEVPLSQLFKKAEGSWSCNACYCTNGSDATACVACQTSRPGYEHVPQPSTAEEEIPQPKFSFGFPAANTAAPTFNFGFTDVNNTTPVLSAPVEDSTPKKSEEGSESTFPPLNLSGKFSFADLAKNNSSGSTFSFATTTSAKPFSGAGAPLFSSLSAADNSGEKKAINTTAHEEGEDDFVPTAEFQPVIPLPPLVEVKKGDEDENTVAEYRAKLYRFIAETKEWKERGVGNIKLLQSKDNERKCRVVMWREKVGKLACNFSLFPDIKVTNYQNNPKVLCWKCQDCTEELTWETFTLRFGNEDNCAHFKTEMERLAKMTVAGVEKSPSSIKAEPVAVEAPTGGNKEVPLSQLFKKPEGSWNCEACYCTNGNDATSCVACQTSRPGYEHVPKPSTAEAEIAQPTFSFGFPAANTAAPTFNFGFGNTNNNTPVSSTAVEDGTPKKSEENIVPAKLDFADLAKNNGPDTTFSFSTTPTTTDSGSCPGCIGCNPDTYQIPEGEEPRDEEILQLSLPDDSSNGPPSIVALNLFTASSDDSSKTDAISSANVKLEPRGESSDSADTKTESAANNSFSNFSFSFQTPEKSTPNSFQFKTPTFSFKSDGNSSIFGAGGGSIFTPPAGGHPPGTTPSPFVSPFAQQPSLLNNSASPQSVSFGGFSQPLFNQTQSPVQSPNNEDAPEEREEDEYEDVDDDDEEEDECMFEDDARVFIQDDVDSGESFNDKGEACVRVLYDGESYCARLVIMIEGETIAEHLVAVETTLEPNGDRTYEWTGICNYDSPVKSRIRAVFSDEDAYKSFSSVMADSLEFAKQAGITEAVLLDETSGGY